MERLGEPLLDEGGRTLFLTSGSGRVLALDARTGKECGAGSSSARWCWSSDCSCCCPSGWPCGSAC
ncbi:hypothetical protein AB0R12_29210 [Streptomyces niveus]|uniref:hypothetical protein n=1 Tax=Streptomyces niveus TaxID=193462 RepID=UPI0034150041